MDTGPVCSFETILLDDDHAGQSGHQSPVPARVRDAHITPHCLRFVFLTHALGGTCAVASTCLPFAVRSKRTPYSTSAASSSIMDLGTVGLRQSSTSAVALALAHLLRGWSLLRRTTTAPPQGTIQRFVITPSRGPGCTSTTVEYALSPFPVGPLFSSCSRVRTALTRCGFLVGGRRCLSRRRKRPHRRRPTCSSTNDAAPAPATYGPTLSVLRVRQRQRHTCQAHNTCTRADATPRLHPGI
jgi:hypothetical protein